MEKNRKIFVEANKPINVEVYPEKPNYKIIVKLVHSSSVKSFKGSSNFSNTCLFPTSGWVSLSIRNNSLSNPEQKAWVKVTYTSPSVVNCSIADSSN
jgi:alpha-amylase